jgi:hypothetical protein
LLHGCLPCEIVRATDPVPWAQAAPQGEPDAQNQTDGADAKQVEDKRD